MELDIELDGRLESVAQARREIGRFAGHLPDARIDDLRLLTSEVVTNAIRHSGARAGGVVRLRVLATGASARVEVHDRGHGFRVQHAEPHVESSSGRGLFLVAALADAWGVCDCPNTCVWFELS